MIVKEGYTKNATRAQKQCSQVLLPLRLSLTWGPQVLTGIWCVEARDASTLQGMGRPPTKNYPIIHPTTTNVPDGEFLLYRMQNSC